MSDLTEFLLVRIAEDEAVARGRVSACGCFPHGPSDPCICDGCWACAGRVVGCTCDIAWDCDHPSPKGGNSSPTGILRCGGVDSLGGGV